MVKIIDIPKVNLQAIVALVSFIAAVFVAKLVNSIRSGRAPGDETIVLYLRMLLGFLLAAAIILGYYSFAGVDVLFGG